MGEGLAPADVERVLGRAERASRIDFSAYRKSTMQRRIELRMAMCEAIGVEEYLARLETDAEEMPALLDALLIKTTWIYREPKTWDVLRSVALGELFAERMALGARMIRAWVPACSTGEEAHTLAMCLDEACIANGDLDFQIFASDVAESALTIAREGVYPLASCTALPDDLRARYLEPFQRDGSRFVRVAENLRARIAFEAHDALRSGRLAPADAGIASFDL
ncbi:MAG: CheR family methyltransferase, partial [Polyangiaceae bacterium]